MLKFFYFFAFVISPLLLLPEAQTLKAQDSPVSELYDFIINLKEDERSLYRFYKIKNSPERRNRFVRFYGEKLSELNNYAFNTLSTGGQVDYLLTQRNINNRLYYLTTEETEYNQAVRV